MHTTPLIRLIAAAAVGVGAAAGLLGVIYYVNADGGFATCTVSTGLGWTVPVVAGLTASGLAWALTVSAHGRQGRTRVAASVCPACGGTVMDDWRLCPHCGQRIGRR